MNHLPDLTAIAAALDALTLPADAELTDAQLIEAQQLFTRVRRAADLGLARCAGIVAHRSRPELGYAGLAQRTGARTPEQFVQQVTGVSRREAGVMVQVGGLMDAAAATPGALPLPPWQRALNNAVSAFDLSTGAANVIRASVAGLDVNDDVLLGAVTGLIRDAKTLSEEKLGTRARQVRD